MYMQGNRQPENAGKNCLYTILKNKGVTVTNEK